MVKKEIDIIVDLDGTLVPVNSFTEFVKFVFTRCKRIRPYLAFIVLLRKMRLISHAEAKRKITVKAEKTLAPDDIAYFTEILGSRVNEIVWDMIKWGGEVMLCTAAPEIYVRPLARKAGIGVFIATPNGGEENSGEHKVESIKALGYEMTENTIVITDHYDDIPLMGANRKGTNYLVNPSAETEKKVRDAGIRYELL